MASGAVDLTQLVELPIPPYFNLFTIVFRLYTWQNSPLGVSL